MISACCDGHLGARRIRPVVPKTLTFRAPAQTSHRKTLRLWAMEKRGTKTIVIAGRILSLREDRRRPCRRVGLWIRGNGRAATIEGSWPDFVIAPLSPRCDLSTEGADAAGGMMRAWRLTGITRWKTVPAPSLSNRGIQAQRAAAIATNPKPAEADRKDADAGSLRLAEKDRLA